MFTSVRSRVVCALLATAMLASLLPALAAASPYDDPFGTSITNPSTDSVKYPNQFELPRPDDASPQFPLSWWRLNWGNYLTPQFSFTHPDPNTPGGVNGFYYWIDRSADTTLSLATPGAYYHSRTANSTMFQVGITNILDVYTYDAPPGGWMYTQPGMRLPYEGQWYLHMKWYDLVGTDYPTHHVPMGIDVTPPLAPTKVTARPSVSYVGTTGIWFPARRMHLTWDNKSYDALSGVGLYDIYVDGVLASSTFAEDGGVYNSATIEDLMGGKHVIDVVAVDRATNRSAKARTYYYSDPDTPTVSITVPEPGSRMPLTSTFKVDAYDEAGLQWVKYYVDGVLIGTTTKAPYSLTKNMSAFANGTRTLKVVVKDMYGREVQTTRTFTLDKNAPVLTGVSDYPDPFYPVLQDGYKDTVSIRFTSNEAGSAQVHIYDADGTRIRYMSKKISAGTSSFVWDGIHDSGDGQLGTFRYKVVVIDTAGNRTTSAIGSITIRDYEIIRIADNAVKVVPR